MFEMAVTFSTNLNGAETSGQLPRAAWPRTWLGGAVAWKGMGHFGIWALAVEGSLSRSLLSTASCL